MWFLSLVVLLLLYHSLSLYLGGVYERFLPLFLPLPLPLFLSLPLFLPYRSMFTLTSGRVCERSLPEYERDRAASRVAEPRHSDRDKLVPQPKNAPKATGI